MRYSLKMFVLLTMVSALVAAQQAGTAAKPKTAGATKPHAAASAAPTRATAALPTEEEVNGFLQAQIGWEPQTTWKIVSIKPSKAADLAEVVVQISGPQGQGGQTFFVSADGKHAVLATSFLLGSIRLQKHGSNWRRRRMARRGARLPLQ